MIDSIIKKIKYEIACWLDKKHPDWCWGDLCVWGLGYGKWNEYNFKNQPCRKEENFKKYGIGWCGKCRDKEK